MNTALPNARLPNAPGAKRPERHLVAAIALALLAIPSGASWADTALESRLTDPAAPKRPWLDIAGRPATPGTAAILITHGANSDATDWAKDMAKAICRDLGAKEIESSPEADSATLMCQAGDWDLWAIDWRSWSRTGLTNPFGAYVGGIAVAPSLASPLRDLGYRQLHLIGFSAGAALIDELTLWLRHWARLSDQPGPEIHETLLDPYDPHRETTPYGACADWTDSYFDARTVVTEAMDFTKLTPDYAFSVEVTPAAEGCDILFPYSAICRHSRPYRFYGFSVDPALETELGETEADPILDTLGLGYPLSVEAGVPLERLRVEFPPGQGCRIDVMECVQEHRPPGAWRFVTATADDLAVDAHLGSSQVSPGIGDGLPERIELESRPGSPSAVELLFTTREAVSSLQFDWRFIGDGESLLRIFADERLVGMLDRRTLPERSPVPQRLHLGQLPPGGHRIGLRLDGFAETPAAILLTEMRIGRVERVENAGLGPQTLDPRLADCPRLADTDGDGLDDLRDPDDDGDGFADRIDPEPRDPERVPAAGIGVRLPGQRRFLLDTDADLSPSDADLRPGPFGLPLDVALAGDWNGDGIDETGLYRSAERRFYLDADGNGRWSASNRISEPYGPGGSALPVAGDWNGDGRDEIGLFLPASGRFVLDLDADLGPSSAETQGIPFGLPDAQPLVGDWDGDGDDDLGVWRPGEARAYLDLDGDRRWTPETDATFRLGQPGDRALAGDWNGDGRDEIGVYRPADRRFRLDLNGDRRLDETDPTSAPFGGNRAQPVAGRWHPDSG
ncbi:FG-GAP repeat domain-containing protein [Imhoffiella purpurea]|uniref:FG-GAP repeat protein n=1 Tax=Imhoffiella purpurea TaxID=1249627 RepID=W9V5E9_9GAMM|nr:VCBS repeat-containing protein [Imhoffiella purpurea]EXJ14574.1 hypothetical protein D779_2366 [Imhoffiella purpurea]